MNMTLLQTSPTSSGVEAGSLTAQWLLWGLPERLGLAATGANPGRAHVLGNES